jgi:plasmid maintenance system antidote protein VapI
MTGRHKITIELIKQISATFGISADWLLGLSDERGGVSSVGGDAEKARMANKIHELEIKVATLENALSLVGGRRAPSAKTGGCVATKTA